MSTIKARSIKSAPLATVLGSFLLVCGSAMAAPPNLWWDHVGPLNMSQTECVAKAKSLLSANKAGKIQASEDSLHAINDFSISVIECLSFSKAMTVMVVVSSNDLEKGDRLFNHLKNGMAK